MLGRSMPTYASRVSLPPPPHPRRPPLPRIVVALLIAAGTLILGALYIAGVLDDINRGIDDWGAQVLAFAVPIVFVTVVVWATLRVLNKR